VYSGDLGQEDQPFIKDPTFIENADYVIMESTYGDRFHKDVLNRLEKLKIIIDETMKKGGNLIVPAFAVERTQDLLYDLNELYVRGELDKNIDVYIDSPLAIAATEIFKQNSHLFDDETMNFVNKGFHPLELPNLKYSRSQEDSMQLNMVKGRTIIISASGMCEAGRIKHHLKHNLWRPESTILFVGYQAEGTLGRKILDGEKIVTIHSEQVTVKADIRQIEAYSSHADQAGLMSWLKKYDGTPKKVFLVHGEEKAQQTLAELIKKEMNLATVIPQWLEEYQLDADTTSEEKVLPFHLVSTATNQALEAEELYLQLRMKLNRFYQESITGNKYAELIEKLNKVSSYL
ncbi:MAG: MBL fold metallo-hydrolase, partial [Syntrophomonadaceae bacterium]|nr:MBL fold metallo-hydrolase [Syntrophomonadaceae bacterium]